MTPDDNGSRMAAHDDDDDNTSIYGLTVKRRPAAEYVNDKDSFILNIVENFPVAAPYVVPTGMPLSIWEDKYSRRLPDGGFQTWEQRLREVIAGNFALDPRPVHSIPGLRSDIEDSTRLAVEGLMMFSGRHLQHGDMDQRNKNMELFTNCSTAVFNFTLFWLLLNGSGVGSDYSCFTRRINYCKHMPHVRLVLDGGSFDDGQVSNGAHRDYASAFNEFGGFFESKREATHKYPANSEDVRWFKVEDSREGWVKVVEILETAAWQEKHSDKMFVFDFSDVRPAGDPIKGQQGRPASGPLPLMRALSKVANLKGVPSMAPWKQSMFIDHYLAACVALGGVRRAARMATKYWKDPDVFDFIEIKRGGHLWSANISVVVDDEFWRDTKDPRSHAWRVFQAVSAAQYYDQTGEPGFVNVGKMNTNLKGVDQITGENYINPDSKLQIHPRTREMMGKILGYIKTMRAPMPYIVNPCVTADTWVMTDAGPRMVQDLIGTPFKALVNGKAYKSNGFFKTGHKSVYNIKTDRGFSVRVTDNHKMLVETERRAESYYDKATGKTKTRTVTERKWIEAGALKKGDAIILHDHGSTKWEGEGSFSEGWLLGQIVGDGCHNPDKYHSMVRFWGDDREEMGKRAVRALRRLPGFEERTNYVDGKHDCEVITQVRNQTLTEHAEKYIAAGSKTFHPVVEECSSDFTRGVLRGLFDSDGSVQNGGDKGRCVRLANNNLHNLEVAQRMLARLGIISTIYKNRRAEGTRVLPDGRGSMREYDVQAQHELHVAKDNLVRFAARVGFAEPAKKQALSDMLDSYGNRGPYKETFTSKVERIDFDGVEDVYDCTVEKKHRFDANGMTAHNCGEIPLALWGAYCVIGDICLARATSLDDVRRAGELMAQALIRVNTMPNLYHAEVNRTNRIGVAITGIHEFAAKFFGLNWYDLVNAYNTVSKTDEGPDHHLSIRSAAIDGAKRDKAMEFWSFIADLRRSVENEANRYSISIGSACPHTYTTIKPSGTISKVAGCTEGAHLPAVSYYMRWVQQIKEIGGVPNPKIAEHEALGYPVKDISHQYNNAVVIGFPTKQPIADILGDDVVTAEEATPAEQFEWLRLIEQYWFGQLADGSPANGQVSYTMKYNPEKVPYDEYMRMLRDEQSTVRCCSVMPIIDASAYAYQPEEKITQAQYEIAMARINKPVDHQEYDDDALSCEGGVCAVDFSINRPSSASA